MQYVLRMSFHKVAKLFFCFLTSFDSPPTKQEAKGSGRVKQLPSPSHDLFQRTAKMPLGPGKHVLAC